MCGIIGYAGMNNAAPFLSEGLKKLEYRGYDSLGIAVSEDDSIHIIKEKGMAKDVLKNIDIEKIKGKTGIGHTRWATHGKPSRKNAHPHYSSNREVVLVHNGVIENFIALRESLESDGHLFESDTDTEIIAHLIEQELRKNSPSDAFKNAISKLEGSYAIVCMIKGEEGLKCARKSSPLLIGIGDAGMFCASDMPAILDHTGKFIALDDGEIAQIHAKGYEITDRNGNHVAKEPSNIEWDAQMAKKEGHPHFMKKEIKEQGQIWNTLISDTSKAEEMLDSAERIDIVACGTSYHAGMMLAFLLQKRKKTAQAFIASDYPQVVNPPENTLVVSFSQSGETADVLQAIRFAKKKGCMTIGITNVNGSTMTTLADEIILLNCGPEIGVAATKTFTAQLAIIYKLVFGKEQLDELPGIIKQMINRSARIKETASFLKDHKDVFFLGRGLSVPIAYEGSLKFKEITYIHSEAYPGGELKHGTLSLIEEGVPVIVLAPDNGTVSKMLGNISEVKARGARIISITDNPEVVKESDYSIDLPSGMDKRLYPFALTIPLQLLAYHVSRMRGIDPDRPRNLAKSVTVE